MPNVLSTTVCPVHGETRRRDGLLIEEYINGGKLWVYLACGHYYCQLSHIFKTPSEL